MPACAALPRAALPAPGLRGNRHMDSARGSQASADATDAQERRDVRLDVWLDVACVFKTRSEARKSCDGGKVEVNGSRAKPHRPVRIGDQIQIGRAFGGRQTLTVRALADRHVPKPEARALYEDTTPPLSPAEIEMRRIERECRVRQRPARPPDKRQRRALRKLKGY
jgi:ribosome-associated heat shock protein Hsp15